MDSSNDRKIDDASLESVSGGADGDWWYDMQRKNCAGNTVVKYECPNCRCYGKSANGAHNNELEPYCSLLGVFLQPA